MSEVRGATTVPGDAATVELVMLGGPGVTSNRLLVAPVTPTTEVVASSR